jgi:hypothetical protein
MSISTVVRPVGVSVTREPYQPPIPQPYLIYRCSPLSQHPILIQRICWAGAGGLLSHSVHLRAPSTL